MITETFTHLTQECAKAFSRARSAPETGPVLEHIVRAGLKTAYSLAHEAYAFWLEARQELAEGMGHSDAKATAQAFISMLRNSDDFLSEIVGLARQQTSGKPDLVALTKSEALLVEVKEARAEAEGIVELLGRPKPPLNREMVAQSRESFLRLRGSP